MKNVNFYKISLILCIVLSVTGVVFRIQHYPYGQMLIILGTLSSLGFIIPGLTDVFKNENNKIPAKSAWLVCFIFLSWITGLVYFKTYKKRNG